MNETTLPPYCLVIQWDPRDAIFVVTVPELPGCLAHGATYEQAVRQAVDAIGTWLDGAREDGEPIPPPRAYTPSPPSAGVRS